MKILLIKHPLNRNLLTCFADYSTLHNISRLFSQQNYPWQTKQN